MLQIVECRRVLKWTYAYGYYLPEHEHAKRQFFEYLQGTSVFSEMLGGTTDVLQIYFSLWTINNVTKFAFCLGEAESGLERLHQCAEKELNKFILCDGPSKEFDEFRAKLAGLTRYVIYLLLNE